MEFEKLRHEVVARKSNDCAASRIQGFLQQQQRSAGFEIEVGRLVLAGTDGENVGTNVCHGQVTNLCTFGAFIDLGGVEGLIHISELSWGRVSHPADILQSGQQVEVYVLNVDRGQGRVGLSLKRLQPDPWNTVNERYQVGQVIEGEITNIVNFGAFVRLEEGLEGLIHTSELSGAAASGLYALHEGARVLVCINSIESERHRIGLSLE